LGTSLSIPGLILLNIDTEPTSSQSSFPFDRGVKMAGAPSFAVIVPFFNEEQNVRTVCLELGKVIRDNLADCEAIFIDDGSDDATGTLLDELAGAWPEFRVYRLEQNQGQAAALLFGFGRTAAPIIITMDGDGQNDPHDIPKLL